MILLMLACPLPLFPWDDKDVVRLGVDPDWEPYEQLSESGEYSGIAADLLSLIFQRAGLAYEVVPTTNWDETLELSQAGGCDALGFLNETKERREWLIFTSPYFVDPNVIITRSDYPYVPNLAALTDTSIALPQGTSVSEKVARDYPNLTIITVGSEREAFDLVDSGEADLTLRSLTMAAYTIRREGWFNLKISGEVPAYQNELRIGVLKTLPDLRDRLDQGVLTISPREVNDAINRHIAIEVGYRVDWQLILRAGLGFLFLVGLILFWAFRERRYNRILLLNMEARKKVEKSLKESELRYRSLVETAGEGIAVIQAGTIVFANPSLGSMLGYTPEELQSLPSFAPLVAPEDRPRAVENHRRRLAGEEVGQRYGLQFLRKDGTIFPVEVSAVTIQWDQEPGTLNFLSDISERREAEEKIRRLALYDQLTNLPNRRLLSESLRQAIGLSRRQGTMGAVFFLDLNKFKPVNDTLGHEVGDRLLCAVADRMKRALRDTDMVTRFGGDEFVILLSVVDNREGAERTAVKLREALEEDFLVDGHSITISASIGIALFPEDGTTESELLRRADAAMYRQKGEKKRGPADGPPTQEKV